MHYADAAAAHSGQKDHFWRITNPNFHEFWSSIYFIYFLNVRNIWRDLKNHQKGGKFLKINFFRAKLRIKSGFRNAAPKIANMYTPLCGLANHNSFYAANNKHGMHPATHEQL